MNVLKFVLGIIIVLGIYSCKKNNEVLSLGGMIINLTDKSSTKSYYLLCNAVSSHGKDTLIIKGAQAQADSSQSILIEFNGLTTVNGNYSVGPQSNDSKKFIQITYSDSARIFIANSFNGTSGDLTITKISSESVEGNFNLIAKNAGGLEKKMSGNFNAHLIIE